MALRKWALGVSALALASFSALSFAHDAKDNADGVTLIHAGTLIAVPGERAKTNVTITVEDGMITSIENGFIRRGDATVIDLSDNYVMPGLIDSHVHLRMEWNPNIRLQAVTMESGDVAYGAADNAKKTLMAGFTAVQDVGGPPEIFALRRAINSGVVPGPHIRASGAAISPTGGHGDSHGYLEEITDLFKSKTICDGPADCRRAVRAAVKSGADVIKITATGGVLSNTNAGTGQQFFDDELVAIFETAEKMGRKVTAHAHGTDGINSSLRLGVDSIEHGTYLDDESIRLFKQNDAVLVPTVIAGMTVVDWANNTNWLPENSRKKALEVGPQMLDMATRAYQGGVTIAFGTDSGVSPHGENAKEFIYMVQAGMSPAEALRSATVVGSKHIGMDDQIGTIEVGKFADIIAVDGDPLADIEEMLDVDFVMKGGVVYKHED